MDRKLLVRRAGDHYHLNFHDFMGSFEGHAIGQRLALTEVENPGPAGISALKPGQFYLQEVMGRHPDLHALVESERLADVVKTADHFHVAVVEGAELLPKLPPEALEKHLDVSFIEQIEKGHVSVWSQGPRAVTKAILIRAIPAAIVVYGIVVASRHMSTTREEVEIAELFRRAARPPAAQSWLSRTLAPDHSAELITSIAAVRFMEGEKIILKDGTVLLFSGMRDVRPMLEASRDALTVPKIDVTLAGGGVQVRAVRVGDQKFGAGSTLVLAERLPASADVGSRSGVDATTPAELVENRENFLDQRVSLRGVLRSDSGAFVFDAEAAGPDLALKPMRAGHEVESVLAEFANAKTELIVDLAITAEEKDGRPLAKLLVLSAQNYHLRLDS